MSKYLALVIVLTCVLSIFNWYEEGHFQGFFISCFGSVFGALVSLVCFHLVSTKSQLPSLPFAISTIIVCFLSLITYSYYAINGQAENSSQSAAHMHVILVPLLLAAISLCFTGLAFLASLLIKYAGRNKT